MINASKRSRNRSLVCGLVGFEILFAMALQSNRGGFECFAL